MCPEDQLVEKVKNMNHFELMSLRVALVEALQYSEFKINFSTKENPQIINKVIQSSAASIESSAAALNSDPESSPNTKKNPEKKSSLHLNVQKVRRNSATGNDDDDADERDSIPEQVEQTPAQISQEMRKNLISLIQSNLLINGCQLTQRKQLGQVLNKYFDGYQSGLSIKLLVESLEYHYEGIDDNAKSILLRGITDLLAECCKKMHRDELGLEKPLELHDNQS